MPKVRRWTILILRSWINLIKYSVKACKQVESIGSAAKVIIWEDQTSKACPSCSKRTRRGSRETKGRKKKKELETRIFDTYNRLLLMDVSLMSNEEKLDHADTMRCLKKKLFANNWGYKICHFRDMTMEANLFLVAVKCELSSVSCCCQVWTVRQTNRQFIVQTVCLCQEDDNRLQCCTCP